MRSWPSCCCTPAWCATASCSPGPPIQPSSHQAAQLTRHQAAQLTRRMVVPSVDAVLLLIAEQPVQQWTPHLCVWHLDACTQSESPPRVRGSAHAPQVHASQHSSRALVHANSFLSQVAPCRTLPPGNAGWFLHATDFKPAKPCTPHKIAPSPACSRFWVMMLGQNLRSGCQMHNQACMHHAVHACMACCMSQRDAQARTKPAYCATVLTPSRRKGDACAGLVTQRVLSPQCMQATGNWQ